MYLQLCAQVGAGRCLSVNSTLKAQQQAKGMLRHFSVRVIHAGIISCCQVGPECPSPQVGSTLAGWQELCVPGWWFLDDGGHVCSEFFCSWEQWPQVILHPYLDTCTQAACQGSLQPRPVFLQNSS